LFKSDGHTVGLLPELVPDPAAIDHVRRPQL